MPRFVIALFVLLAGLSSPARAAEGIPTKPDPFTFVTDQAHLLSAADAQKLGNGLSKYAASTGTPVIVVTVPSLGGHTAADLARQIGNTWQVGQADKNNGIVVLISSQQHKLSIEAGSGMQGRITPAVVQQVIQEMTPAFKQNDYFGGLRKGLSTLMLTANPSSDPRQSAANAASGTATQPTAVAAAPLSTQQTETPAEPVSTGLPWGTILLGLVIVVGGFMLVRRLFSSRNAASSQGSFGGGQPTGPMGNTPNFGAPNAGYQQGGGYGAAPSSGPGMGGLLATGAAAAAGAYLGNRLGSNHDSDAGSARNFDNDGSTGAGVAGTAAGATAGSDYFAGRNGGTDSSAGPDYFSDDNSASSSPDYFSDDNSGGGDTSGDFGGGDFSSSDDNSGSW